MRARGHVHRILNSLHLIPDDGLETNAALLLFAKDPQKWFVSSTVKCVQFYRAGGYGYQPIMVAAELCTRLIPSLREI